VESHFLVEVVKSHFCGVSFFLWKLWNLIFVGSSFIFFLDLIYDLPHFFQQSKELEVVML